MFVVVIEGVMGGALEGRMLPGEHERGREMGSKGGGPTFSRRLRRPFSGSIRAGWVGGGAGEGTIWSLGGVNLGHLDACAHTPPPPSHPPTRPDRRQIGACMGPAHVVSCPRGGSHSSTHSIPTCGQLKCVHAPYHLTSPPHPLWKLAPTSTAIFDPGGG